MIVPEQSAKVPEFSLGCAVFSIAGALCSDRCDVAAAGGVATREDRDAFLARAEAAARKGAPPPDATPQMRVVAEARMRAVGSALSADPGISASQLQVCPEPRVDPADPGPPRVDIGF